MKNPKRDGQDHIPHDGSAHLNILIAGLGNPILGDDGVGWQVVSQVQSLHNALAPELEHSQVHIEYAWFSLGGLSLMEHLIGFDKAILVDAISLGEEFPQGYVHLLTPQDLPDLGYGHTNSSHDMTFKNALAMGRSLGAHLPEQIVIVGIECAPNFEFSEHLSPQVANALPEATQKVLQVLKKWIEESK